MTIKTYQYLKEKIKETNKMISYMEGKLESELNKLKRYREMLNEVSQ